MRSIQHEVDAMQKALHRSSSHWLLPIDRSSAHDGACVALLLCGLALHAPVVSSEGSKELKYIYRLV